MTTQTTTEASKLTVSELDRPIYTIDELIRRRALELGDTPLIGYPKEGLLDFEEHSARALDQYVDAAVQKLLELGLTSVDSTLEESPVVGILAQSGLHVIITIMALSRLGYAAFLISTRLASPAITRLCELANCTAMLTTPNFHTVLSEVQQQRHLDVLPLLEHSDYYGKDAPKFTRAYDQERENKKIAAIIHSSGSTGLPKPIYLTHRSCIGAFATNMGLRAFICSPLFHSHGFYEIFRSIYSRLPIYLGNYNIPLTSQNLIKMLDYVKPDIFHVVPYVVKLLAETEEGIQALANVKLVLFGGSSCPDELGDRLVSKGVYLVGNYGCTEIGRVMNSVRPAGDKAWNYMRPLPVAKPYVFMDEISPRIFECVCLDGYPAKSTSNSDDPPNSFRTRDLFKRHPTEPDWWKYISRLDDRFTLINGEKVLPIPIEGRIRQEQIVKEAIVFGEQRDYPGVLIVKADGAAHIPDEQFIEEIWPAVEAANAQAESFSRIPRELVVILPHDAEYPKTDKGTFIRVPFYQKFDKEIQAAYDRYENENEVGGSLALEGEELENWLLQQLNEKSENALSSVDADFFASGIDSLLCIQMWSLMKRKLDLGGRQGQLGQNVLYETGNIKELARHLEGLRSGREDAAKDEFQKMEDLIAKYSSFKTHAAGSAPKPEKDLILVTGVTGGLGAHILAQLATFPHVSQVWAAVRASDDEAAAARVDTSLSSRGINLTQEQRAKVIPLSIDLGRPDFGLGASRLSELKSKLTLVIHSAWAVNFNIPVQSFEDQHIKAVHNLIQLCQSVETPNSARFFFCSSVSSAGGTPRPGTVAEGPVPTPRNAQGTGYARSKYVSEHITRNANKSIGAPARVLRIGQLVGDSKVGEWNTTEGIPLMIQTAVTLGALPKLDEEMTWLPVDLGATIIIEMTNADRGKPAQQVSERDSDPDLVYHVLNPTRFHWAKQMLPSLSEAGLKFEALPTDQWMERLRKSERDPKKNPPIKLLDWFESKYGHGAGAAGKGVLEYLTEETFVRLMVDKLKVRWEAGN
ncbi:male sterility protein [Colletotrichum karsti]|uniref:Male sterility protein n=1 Tax=Colletotrichum karsti TaxID=1095194 RepID=A0A9P6LD39_9PEZI|nr:male sterility protein [Colletotrichum karsti]KAF9870749.1 male sterility protein [Colletotrichum karsti]